nr:LuxR C-terminal-related transcriptional regulator [Endozoicomonas sp.]
MILANGLTLDETAEELGISRNTARAHLRSIFSKTGVTRQTMLVRLILKSVATLG